MFNPKPKKRIKEIKTWAVICNAGGGDYFADADCSLGFDIDNGYTEALAIFENKWLAKRWIKRTGKVKCKTWLKKVVIRIIN